MELGLGPRLSDADLPPSSFYLKPPRIGNELNEIIHVNHIPQHALSTQKQQVLFSFLFINY